MDEVQESASRVVRDVLNGRNLDETLERALAAASAFTPQQRGALRDLCFGTLRFYGELGEVLKNLVHKPVQEDIKCLLLVALYQLHYTKAAHHAIVNHAVAAVRRINPAAGGFTNAVLRNFLRRKEELLAQAAAGDEGRYSYQKWWIKAIRAQYGQAASAILSAGNLHPPMTLRVNRRMTNTAEYLERLKENGIEAEIIPPGAILLKTPVPVEKLPGFFEGLISIQDAGAQYAAHLLDVRDGMRVLDACAAPGGKTTHVLELATVDLWALDKDETRLSRVRENLQRLKLSAQVKCGDAGDPEAWWDQEPFERILADVPCSASGVVRRHPDIKWLRRAEDIEGFARQQLGILTALWRLLARDGKLLYATCSVFARENQHVVEEFLRQHNDAEWLPLSMSNLKEGALLPDDQHDGFYYALLHKPA
jgi:16S rRNA (cytosine967-C5)-methyltransferase